MHRRSVQTVCVDAKKDLCQSKDKTEHMQRKRLALLATAAKRRWGTTSGKQRPCLSRKAEHSGHLQTCPVPGHSRHHDEEARRDVPKADMKGRFQSLPRCRHCRDSGHRCRSELVAIAR
jgi:hypothetical protein